MDAHIHLYYIYNHFHYFVVYHLTGLENQVKNVCPQ